MNIFAIIAIAFTVFVLIRFPPMRQPAMAALIGLGIAAWVFVRIGVVVLSLFGRGHPVATWVALDTMNRK
jgi:hypothetical protein